MRVRKEWMDIISNILKQGMKLNSVDSNTFFFEFSGHVEVLSVNVCLDGWKSDRDFDHNYAGFMYYVNLHKARQVGTLEKGVFRERDTGVILREILSRLEDLNAGKDLAEIGGQE